ncbi:kinase-like protein [Trametes versicolor FP-101664 SS1]|uniref:kinase-like protein n=1 Tax=Trametes versicolor (strain FP-101664) TaxID=717944 RepID=UPI00046217DE|nr:kinase-like protein [Trametes versicolor FP-101664 SS1]EIW63030.1 kinase-like protein [Trametes versicolor FP-101664 SS1]
MLQYPVQLPPLSLSSSKRTAAPGRDRDLDDRRNGHSRLAQLAVHDRIVAPRPPSLAISPLSTSIALSRNSSSSVSTYPSPLPSPISTTPAKPIHRSPLVSSSRQLPSPVPRSPHPLRSDLPSFDTRSSGASSISSYIVDVLTQGDLVGEGLTLQGEVIQRVPISSSEPRVDDDEPAKEFEVVRKLGSGSYAVVYLVREVLSRPQPSDDGHAITIGRMDLDDGSPGNQSTEYGREYAIKVLSKANLDEEALEAQLFEATIHQSLPAHPNIVTLHRTLETPSFLLLLLEFVPGEDLFYFLEQARDHYEMDPSMTDLSTSPPVSDSSCASRTPPTPSLLSSLNPSQLLSRTRLRLIASMFSQMCEAVATCHEHSVFHRDIKPENFIVTDGWTTLPDGRSERKVIVKLSDFGLSTTDVESADMDCGSAPYMSFECRNNIHPTYSPRAADVWSLGIVLINMLYHYNPWTDTTLGVCSSFELYRRQPVNFFMQRFTGMTYPVADFLASNVFCILDSAKDDSQRISARAFGAWIKDLPSLLCPPMVRPGHVRNVSITSVQGHRLSSIPHSRRPSLRNSVVGEVISRRASRNFSRAPSLGPAYEHQALDSPIMLPPVLDRENEQEIALTEHDNDHHDQDQDGESEVGSRSASTQKRRKRGARKGKGSAMSPTTPASAHDATLETLAHASQALAREISRTSRHSQVPALSTGFDSVRTHSANAHPMPYPVSPNPALPPLSLLNASVPLSIPPPGSAAPSISKKPSKWKLSFGKASVASGNKLAVSEEASVPSEAPTGKQMSATASNVTSLLMSLNAPPPPSSKTAPAPASHLVDRDDDAASWNRGRRPKQATVSPNGTATWGPSSGSPFGPSRGSPERRYPGQQGTSGDKRSERGISPSSTRSGRPLASSASSMASSNWRSSMSSAGTSTSAFTRYSNNSARSVSTAATSVSAQSWRSQGSKASHDQNGAPMPANVKFITGTPWELYQLPRQMYPNPDDAKFGGPPARKRRANKPKDLTLDTINERPAPNPKSPLGQRQDAATSTTDLGPADSGESIGSQDGSPRKVQKGQINALAKMLSALRR